MRSLHNDTTGLTVASAQTVLPGPSLTGTTFMKVADLAQWNQDSGVPPEMDLEISAADATNLTAATVIGAVEVDAALESTAVDSVTNGDNTATITGHGLTTGTGPVQIASTLTVPPGLEEDTDYWLIATDANTLKFAETLEDAVEGTAIALTGDGTGDITIVGADAKSLRYLSYGLIGQAGDGAIALTEAKGWTETLKHRPRTRLIGVSATLSAAEAVTVVAYPRRDK